MNIGETAARTGLPAKTIRYYESIGLIEPAARTRSRYRSYGPEDVHTLVFLRRARSLGFTVEQCRELLALYRDDARASADVRALAQQHLADIEAKLAELQALKRLLEPLVAGCRGDDGPDCPILDTLAGGAR
jgi:MerR family transcriptional regulator, copper efflux regulator